MREFHRVVGTEVTSRDSACDHHDALSPVDGARHHERHYRDAVDHGTHDALEGIHGVDVGHSERG